MNFFRLVLITTMSFAATLFAADLPPLTIGVESFSPPFVMQTSKNEIYGYDIDLMDNICKTMQRTCNYRVMRFDQLLISVANKSIDMAISSLTITPERSKVVSFSLPYLISYSRFLGGVSFKAEPFKLKLFNGKTIGIETGTVFLQQVNTLGLKNIKIKQYSSIANQLAGLGRGEVDLIILDNPIANYWAANSSEKFKLIGPPYIYGFGVGIAVNINNPALLANINEALLKYQNSKEYTLNYNKYLLEF